MRRYRRVLNEAQKAWKGMDGWMESRNRVGIMNSFFPPRPAGNREKTKYPMYEY